MIISLDERVLRDDLLDISAVIKVFPDALIVCDVGYALFVERDDVCIIHNTRFSERCDDCIALRNIRKEFVRVKVDQILSHIRV